MGASSLPAAFNHALVAQGVPHADAARVAALPPVSVMSAALLGYNPVQTLLGPAIAKLPASHAAYLTGRSFFPSLISPAFSNGLSIAFGFAIAACLIARDRFAAARPPVRARGARGGCRRAAGRGVRFRR